MMQDARHRISTVAAAVAVLAASLVVLVGGAGCRNENDPNYWLGKMDQPVWRDQALTNLERLFSEKMREGNNDRANAAVQEYINTTAAGLIELYPSLTGGGTEDVTSANKIVALLSQMESPTAQPVYQAALADVSGTKLARANTAAEALARFCRGRDVDAEFVPPPSKRDDAWRQSCSAAATSVDALLQAAGAVDEERNGRGDNAENTGEEDALTQALVSALGNILLGNPDLSQKQQIIDKLIHILETPDTRQDLRINMAALKMLGRIGDSQAVPVMVRALFMQGKRRPVALQEVARSSIMEMNDLGAMAEALVRAGQMQDTALNSMQEADPNFDVRLIKEQVAITLGQLGISSQPVLAYLMAEFDHSELDDFDRTAPKGPVNFTPEISKSHRRSFAAQALGSLRHQPALATLVARLATKSSGGGVEMASGDVDILEAPGYIDAAGDFLAPRQTNAVLLPFALRGDDALMDRAGRRLALQAGANVAQRMQKKAESMEDCPEEARRRGCVKDHFLKRYVPMLRSAQGCTDLACWVGKVGDSNANIRERAAYQLAMLAVGNEGASTQARTALLGALDEQSADVLAAYTFALDRLSPGGCNEECLNTIDTAIMRLRGRNSMNAARRSLAGLRARLAYRARTSQ
jgi:hypothetical protein